MISAHIGNIWLRYLTGENHFSKLAPLLQVLSLLIAMSVRRTSSYLPPPQKTSLKKKFGEYLVHFNTIRLHILACNHSALYWCTIAIYSCTWPWSLVGVLRSLLMKEAVATTSFIPVLISLETTSVPRYST